MSSAVENRLSKLERGAAGRTLGRFIEVSGGPHSDQKLQDLLRSEGVVLGPHDLVFDDGKMDPSGNGPETRVRVIECTMTFEEALAELDRADFEQGLG